MHDAPAIHAETLAGMRVLLVSHDLTLSGAPLLLVQMGGLLRRSGAIVHLASCNLGGAERPVVADRARAAGLERVALPPATDPAALVSAYDMIVVNTLVVAPWVETLLGAQDARVRALCARRIVWWVHEIQPRYVEGFASRLLEAVLTVVFDSHSGLERWRGLAAVRTGEVIYPAIADDILARAAVDVERSRSSDPKTRAGAGRGRTRAELGFGDDDFVALAVGIVPAEKGALELLAAFRQFYTRARATTPAPRLVVLGCDGDGLEVRSLRQFLGEAGADVAACVRLLPTCADPFPYFAAADVLVVNTLPPGEMFGRVSTEAMAYRLPVLASDQGGSVEIVLNGVTGWLHDPTRPEELADRLVSLAADRDQRARLGEAGFRRVRTVFGEAEMARRWCQLAGRVGAADSSG